VEGREIFVELRCAILADLNAETLCCCSVNFLKVGLSFLHTHFSRLRALLFCESLRFVLSFRCRIEGYVDANKVPGSFHISCHGLGHLLHLVEGRLNVNHVVHSFYAGETKLDPEDFPVCTVCLLLFAVPTVVAKLSYFSAGLFEAIGQYLP